VSAPGKLLAVDVSQNRIGLATCDPLGLSVRPLAVIRRSSRRADFAAIARHLQAEAAQAVLCGLPLNMDGSEGPRAGKVREWALRLAQGLRAILGYPVPVIFWDERLTTFAARELMAETHMDAGEDAVAASVILRTYLDARRRGSEEDYGEIRLPKREA
jgi:putative holliday junction resolvase